jgi:hypothetical protein
MEFLLLSVLQNAMLRLFASPEFCNRLHWALIKNVSILPLRRRACLLCPPAGQQQKSHSERQDEDRGIDDPEQCRPCAHDSPPPVRG